MNIFLLIIAIPLLIVSFVVSLIILLPILLYYFCCYLFEKKIFNFFVYALKVVVSFNIIIFNYFFWILPYSRKIEKIPITKRYNKVRKLIKTLIKVWHINVKAINLNFLNENDGPYFGVSNHRNFCDPAFYIYLSEKPISFIAKKELMKKIIVGRVIRIIDGVFIDRDDLRSHLSLFNEVAEKIKTDKISYFIFPEGTRNKNTKLESLLPYKNGSIKIAYFANVNIMPSVLFGTESVLKVDVKEREVIIEIMEPIIYDSFKDKNTIEVTDMIYQNTNNILKLMEKYLD